MSAATVAVTILAVCLSAAALLLSVMVAVDYFAGRTILSRGVLGSLGIGASLLLFSAYEFTMHRQAARTGRTVYNRGAVVTPAQGYLAATGFLIAGSSLIVVTCYQQRRRRLDERSTSTI